MDEQGSKRRRSKRTPPKPEGDAPFSGAVLVGKVSDLSQVPLLIMSYGIVRIDSQTHVSSDEPDLFRTYDKAGPGSLEHPLTRRARLDGREAQIVVAKIRKEMRLRQVSGNRRNKSDVLIMEAWEKHKHLGHRASRAVAELLGFTTDYVGRVVKRNKPA